MKPNGRPPASPTTEIKKCVTYAMRTSNYTEQKDGSVKYAEMVLDSGYGPIKIRLVAHSPFQKSHYQVSHPVYGQWMGYLTSVSERNGEYGVNVAAPRRIRP